VDKNPYEYNHILQFKITYYNH